MVGAVISAVNARAARLAAGIAAKAGWRLLIWGAATAVLALILDFVPLFDLLGYDFSFALGLLTAPAAVDIGCGVVAAARRRNDSDSNSDGITVPRLVGRAVAFALAILLIPLLLSLLNALRVRNCNLGAGLAFFL